MENKEKKHPNIILIVIDALRARNLGCYGGKPSASPNIDSMAKGGVQFSNCYSCWNTTDQSLTTIFTGRYPRTHGIVHHGDKVTPEDMVSLGKLNPKLLAQLLHDAGFKTFAVDWMGRWFKRGFDFYGYRLKKNFLQKFFYVVFFLPYVHLRYMAANISLLRIYSGIRKTSLPAAWKGLKGVWDTFRFTFELARVQDADFVTRFGREVIEKAAESPFFLFLHYWDTHTPYHCPKKYSKIRRSKHSKIDIIASKYEGAVSYVDKSIGDLIAVLKKQQILDNTWIIVTSDHGESLTEHDMFFDHHGLYDVTTHVPLIFYNQKFFSRPKKIPAFIQHIDLVPTILDYMGIDHTNLECDGTSLRPLINGEITDIRNFAFFEESYVQRKIGLRNKTHKYIYAPDGIGMCSYCQKVHAGVEELYDLAKDPEEIHNAVSGDKTTAARMRAGLEQVIQKLDDKRRRLLEKKDLTRTDWKNGDALADQKRIKKKLRSLGYMD
jgi:arylsulfatase A-like enzyme